MGGVEEHPSSRPDCPAWRWYDTTVTAFENLWTLLHGDESWNANLDVVALTFKVHRQNAHYLFRQKEAV
jgi:hypothetical protein